LDRLWGSDCIWIWHWPQIIKLRNLQARRLSQHSQILKCRSRSRCYRPSGVFHVSFGICPTQAHPFQYRVQNSHLVGISSKTDPHFRQLFAHLLRCHPSRRAFEDRSTDLSYSCLSELFSGVFLQQRRKHFQIILKLLFSSRYPSQSLGQRPVFFLKLAKLFFGRIEGLLVRIRIINWHTRMVTECLKKRKNFPVNF